MFLNFMFRKLFEMFIRLSLYHMVYLKIWRLEETLLQ